MCYFDSLPKYLTLLVSDLTALFSDALEVKVLFAFGLIVPTLQ